MYRALRMPFCLLGLAASLACAQGAHDNHEPPGRAGPPVHVSESGRYALRANAINSEFLPPGTAARHGIDRASDRGVLNLAVLEGEGTARVTVPAKVSATKDNLLGQVEEIEMREVLDNGRVSYVGTFGFAPLRNLHFTITARPAGSRETLRLQFEDRFEVRR